MGSPTNVDHFVMWCSKVAISALRPLPTLNATFPPAPHYDLTHLVSCPSSTVFADCLPRHTLPPFSGRAAFTALVVLFSRPTTPGTPLPTSLSLIGLLPSVARGFQESSWGHAQIFRTVPSANTLVRWVNENAFAPVLRARPCPTFGRPVRPWGSPHRLRPGTSPHTLRIPPRDGHPVLRSTSSGGFRSVLAVSGFRLRARLDVSIPFLSLRPARHYPRFWIRRPSSERRRDFNPPDSCAARRTLRAPPPLCPALVLRPSRR